MVLPFGSAVYANTQALPNGMIITENGVEYLEEIQMVKNILDGFSALMMNGIISMRPTRP